MKISVSSKTVERFLDRISSACAELYRPIGIVRDAKARAEARRIKALSDESLKIRINSIREGGLSLPPSSGEISSTLITLDRAQRIEPWLEKPPRTNEEEVAATAEINERLDKIEKTLNLRAIQRLAEEIAEDRSPSIEQSSSQPAADWVSAWRSGAERSEAADMQLLWAKILCGEIEKPGAYSRRTIEFLRTIGSREANLINKIGPYIFADGLLKISDPNDSAGGALDILGVSFDEQIELMTMGVIGEVGLGVNASFESFSDPSGKDIFLIGALGNKAVRFEINKPSSLVLPKFALSPFGKEILSLGTFTPDNDYIFKMALLVEKKYNIRINSICMFHSMDGVSYQMLYMISENWPADRRRNS